MEAVRKYVLTLVAFAAILGTRGVQAQPTVVCNTSPIIFGNGLQFQLTGGDMGWGHGACKWEYQWSVGSCAPGWQLDQNTGDSVGPYYLQYPGALKVRCTVEYNDGSGGHKMTFTPDTTINVPPPDGIRIVSGDGVSIPFGQFNPTVFQVTCQGKDSIYFSCFAQEKITKVKYLTTGKTLPDQDWVPTAPGQPGSKLFYFSEKGQIVDKKGLPQLAVFGGLPANTPLLSCHQDIRISITDPCGKLMAPIKLGKGFDVTETKDSQNMYGGTYTITHK